MPWNDRGKYGIRLPEMKPKRKIKRIKKRVGPKIKRVRLRNMGPLTSLKKLKEIAKGKK